MNERAGRYAGFCPALLRKAETVTAIYLGVASPQPSSGLPDTSASSLIGVCLTLLRARFTQRARSLGPLVVSYTTVSPLPRCDVRTVAVCSLLHFLADHSGWVLPTALLCGARTFLGAHLAARDATVWPARSSPQRSGRMSMRAPSARTTSACPSPRSRGGPRASSRRAGSTRTRPPCRRGSGAPRGRAPPCRGA